MSSPDFESLGIASPVLKAVQQLGYEQPSPIQEQSIPNKRMVHRALRALDSQQVARRTCGRYSSHVNSTFKK